LSEIADADGQLTRSWVSRMHTKALQRLRRLILETKGAEDDLYS
jgi:hypothetical protein